MWRVKDKFPKTRKPHGVQSVNNKINKFHFSVITEYIEMSIADDKKVLISIFFIFISAEKVSF
jgi:hypothetical protein